MTNPATVVCLESLQLILASGYVARGVLVRVSVDGGTVRTCARVAEGDVILMAGFLDRYPVKAAAVVTASADGEFRFRFAALPPGSRAHLARFVFGHLQRSVVPGRKPPQVRNVTIVEPSRSQVSSRVSTLRDTDRHATPHVRWIGRQAGDPGRIIAPRTR